jgi:hypothetical protein
LITPRGRVQGAELRRGWIPAARIKERRSSGRRALLFPLLCLLRLQAVQIIRCPLGVGGCAENSAFNYSNTVLPHIWKYQEFSAWMTDTMHDASFGPSMVSALTRSVLPQTHVLATSRSGNSYMRRRVSQNTITLPMCLWCTTRFSIATASLPGLTSAVGRDTLRLDSGDDVRVIIRFDCYRGRDLMHCTIWSTKITT